MRTLRLIFAIALTAACSAAMAQAPVDKQHEELLKNHKIVYFGKGEADSTAQLDLINRFYINQFRHAQDPRAPYFMLMSRSGNMAMGIGGTIKVIGAYDWDGSMSGTDFSPYNIPIPVNAPNRSLFQASIGSTNIFFSVFGSDKRFGDYQLYVEAKFNGNRNAFRLNKAYATVRDFTLGLANSTFVDPASQPSTVETDGPNSETDYTTLLFRYMHTFGKHFTLAASVENPNNEIGTFAHSEGTSAYMPNFAAFAQYQWGKQHIRLAAIVKPMRYRNLAADCNQYTTGWGLNLSTIFRPVAPLTVYAAANYGCGISSIVNDLQCGALDLLPYANEVGKMYAPRSFGWYAGLQYNFRPNIFSTIVVSQERMLRKDNTVYDGDGYKYGLYGVANIFWDITPRCQVGAEFDLGKRCNVDGTNRLGYRACALAQFSF